MPPFLWDEQYPRKSFQKLYTVERLLGLVEKAAFLKEG